MKRHITMTCLLLTFALAKTQSIVVKQWDSRFGGNSAEQLTTFIKSDDGGYLLGGWSYSGVYGDKTQPNWDTTNQTRDMWVVKTNSEGQKEWDRRFGGTDRDDLSSIVQTFDGGFLIGGTTFSDIGGDISQVTLDTASIRGDYWVIKIDALGNKQWDKRYGGGRGDYLVDMKATKDAGYILGGYSMSSGGGDKSEDNWGGLADEDFWVVKVDSIGNKQWDKHYGGIMPDIFSALQQTKDGGYIFGGSSNSDSSGNKTQDNWSSYPDYWVIKTDSIGNREWDRRYGGTGVDNLHALAACNDGGYLLAGSSNSTISGNKTQGVHGNGTDYWIVKTDTGGNIQWDNRYGGYDNDGLLSAVQTLDGGYLLCGSSTSSMGGEKSENNLGISQAWTIKTDSIGFRQWDKTIQTPDSGTGYSWYAYAQQTKDSCYAVATYVSGEIGGYCTQPNRDSIHFTSDYWFTKFCIGETDYIPQLKLFQVMEVYPNPATNKLTLQTTNMQGNKYTLQILALDGQVLMQQVITNPNQNEIDVSMLPAGMYLIALQDEKQRAVRKFVKQ
jgi:hypothetical protein